MIHLSCLKKCGPSRSLFDQYTAPGVQLPYQFCARIVEVQEFGGREASSDQSNTDVPYLTHQLCGYEGQKLYTTSSTPTASRGKYMDASRGRSCPSPVSLQTSTSYRLGTDQMWLQDILQGSLLMQEEQFTCTDYCLQLPQF